jgi:nitrite reductase (NADH) small subunit
METTIKEWLKTAVIEDFNVNGGTAILYKDKQIAVFHFHDTNEWFATQNMCPHMKEMVLSRGLIGDKAGEHKVACPLHKHSFSLQTGQCLTTKEYKLEIFPVKIEEGFVYVGIPDNF